MFDDNVLTKLSLQDVELLQENPSVDVLVGMLRKLSEQYKNQNLSKKEEKLSEEIFKIILSNPNLNIRQVLARELKDFNHLPEDICWQIAQDSPDVANLFIQESPCLSEKNLILLVRQGNEKKQNAVASRLELPFRVCEALAEEAFITPIQTLISNETADISDYAYQRLIERFQDNESIYHALLMRKNIPNHILEKLISIVSDELKKQLLMRRDLSAPLVTILVSQEREKAILSLAQSSTEDEVRALVIHLNGINKLTPNLILRAACVGDMKFFEYAIALRAGIPIRNTRILIYDSGLMGLERIYEEAELPKEMFSAIQLAVKTYKEMMNETEDGYRDHFCRRLVERLLILFDENDIQLDGVDMEYLLNKIGKNKRTVFDSTI